MAVFFTITSTPLGFEDKHFLVFLLRNDPCLDLGTWYERCSEFDLCATDHEDLIEFHGVAHRAVDQFDLEQVAFGNFVLFFLRS